ncbi:hypothetical protein Ssi02_51600 [Sinosporangium siamense]|uniref:Uncharacterized protein n=1 Tax=Sinosporangium siamense TaxID=1367973 RepID=A0A919RMW0_9ACTN|nr:hypothetical protein Ssi02_51600 [Sinosporangium siamense]
MVGHGKPDLVDHVAVGIGLDLAGLAVLQLGTGSLTQVMSRLATSMGIGRLRIGQLLDLLYLDISISTYLGFSNDLSAKA